MNGNRLKVEAVVCKRDSIVISKFVARQHAFLTDISDQLNICYSFQV